MTTAQAPPGKEQAPGLASEGSSKNNITDTPRVTDDGAGTRDVVLYQVGYGTGYDIGYAHGRRDENDEWQALLSVYRAAVRTPRHADLETARQPTDEPCPTRCRSCSRCARYAQARRNRRRYGACDYPGGGTGW